MRDVYISIVINGMKGGKSMVQPIEAGTVKSICALVDRGDWDAAQERLDELGVKVHYRKGNRPLVNVEEVREASRRWCMSDHPAKVSSAVRKAAKRQKQRR